MRTVDIYTDGSFREGNYSWAYVVYENSQEIFADSGIGKNEEALSMRNVAGELSAVMRALNWAKKQGDIEKLNIYHDYEGVRAWVNGSWKAKNPFTQQYAAFMRPFYSTGFVVFNKVTGHSGNRGNERADELAAKCFVGGRE